VPTEGPTTISGMPTELPEDKALDAAISVARRTTIVVFIRLFHIFSQIRPERMSYAVLYYYSTIYDYLYYY